MQFNGKCGCIFCLHPTARNSSNTSQIYPLMPDIKIRTNNCYKRHVNKATELQLPKKNQSSYKGIKGFSYLSNWINIPEDILLDYMHLCLIGTFKTIICNLFDSSNKNQPYYLGKFFIYFDIYHIL